MSEVQPQIQEQPQTQTPVQSQFQPQLTNGFSGKQVVGITVGVLVILALGVAIGGIVGYRLGTTEGAQQALANLPPAQAPALNQQTPPDQPAPRGFDMPFQQLPFSEQLPALNAGGAYLGITFQMLTPEIAAQEGLTGTTGALVREVVTDGPAANAGVKPGDIILAVDGQPVDEKNDLRARVAKFKPNDEVTLTLAQSTANGPTDQRDVKVKLGERSPTQSFEFQVPFGENGLPAWPFDDNGQPSRPETAPVADGPYLGVEYELITAEVAAREQITGTTGALIKVVVADSPAAKAGLKAGDVISTVNGQAVDEQNNLREIVQTHQVGDEITLTIVKGTANGPTDQRERSITLAARPAQRQFQLPPGFPPGEPSPDSREG
ncbi:Periplasmic pH-dependent serine endoprotease DegQ [Thermoflexales bacterium]|nr:Periplasmic pH-dependent serine endoprotease DegQ [Thermoflexales bacterium]